MADSFLSQAELEAAIEKVSRTREGKAAIRDAMGKKNARFVARFANGSPREEADTAAMRRKASEMAEILFQHITSDTQVGSRHGLENFPKDAIIIGKPEPVGNTGDFRINISFDAEALRRQSLDPNRYPDGITDIVSLFVHGYAAGGSVLGRWHGFDQMWSLTYRSPNDFMTRAVEEFNKNNEDGSVKAALTQKYK